MMIFESLSLSFKELDRLQSLAMVKTGFTVVWLHRVDNCEDRLAMRWMILHLCKTCWNHQTMECIRPMKLVFHSWRDETITQLTKLVPLYNQEINPIESIFKRYFYKSTFQLGFKAMTPPICTGCSHTRWAAKPFLDWRWGANEVVSVTLS